jgi:hypothetical protein
MRPAIAAFFVIFSMPSAPALRAQSKPPVSISTEPHHHLVLQNAFVRVYRLVLAPHERTLPYTVEHDCISETVQDGQPAARFDGVVGNSFSPAGKPSSYARGPFTNVWRNGTNDTYTNITVELLQPQGRIYSECVKITGAQELGCRTDIELGHSFFFGTKGALGLVPDFRTDELTQSALMIFGGKKLSLKMKDTALLIFDTQSGVRFRNMAGKKVNLKPGDVLWVTAGSQLDVKNHSNRLDRVTVIMFR